MHGNVRDAQERHSLDGETGPSFYEDPQIDLRAILGILRRHKWTIVGTIVGVVGIAMLITSQLEKRYSATALVVVDRRDSQLLGFEPGFSEGIGTSGIVDTEVEIARSSKILRRAAEALDLANSPEFAERPSLLDLLGNMVGLGAVEPRRNADNQTFAGLSSEEQARIVDQLSRTVDISRRGLTSVMSLSATASSRQAAAMTANVLANAYLEEQIEARLSSNERAASFLRNRVETLAREIRDGDAAIDAFVTAKLEELGSPEAKALLVNLGEEAKLRQSSGRTLADLRRALKSEDYVRLAELAEAQQFDLVEQRQALVKELAGTDDQARIAEAKRKLEALDAEIKAAAEKRAGALEEEISTSNSRTAEFRRQIEATLTDLKLPKEVSAELFRLQRDAETRRTLYDSFLAKLRQVEQQTDFNIPDSRIIAAATPPAKPSFPPTRLIAAAALFLSLGMGIGWAFLREQFIGGVTSIDQFENLTAIPVAAGVPRHSSERSGESVDLAIVNQPLSAVAEAIRRIRLSVDALGPEGKRVILVTSPLPGDGKTTIALALARQFAMTGSSTLLIDADLRHPSVHRFLNEDVGPGLMDYLSRDGVRAAEQLPIVKEQATDVDYVFGAEASVIATDALLMSRRFGDLMKFARTAYDIVIVDTPPVGLVVDATIVARHCDAAIFVVRYASTSQHQIRASLRELRRSNLPICGVLNQIAKADSYDYNGTYKRYYR